MSANPADSEQSLGDGFEMLLALNAEARSLRLAKLPPELASRLRALLEADAASDAGIDAALCSDAAATIAPELAGQRIGSWRIVRELGSGGMGTVFLAERDKGGFTQQAAIKLIRGFPSQDGMRRLRQERQILAALEHPDIARLIDGGETEAGQPFLVVEYVCGQTLDAYLQAQQPERDARIALIERIGAAVQYAHQHLVIHRDLKPSNVMVTDEGDIKLLDFGVAKLIDVGDADAHGSTRVFTPGYASPEQAAGRSVGIATDIYSLGVMLRESLSRIPASAELSGIIAKATAQSASDRYATVAALCDDLSRLRAGLPVSAAADTAWYRTRKFISRHRIAAAASVIALALALGFVWRLQVERARALAAEALAANERDSARQSLDLLQGIFDSVAPGVALGHPVGAREFIAAAETQLSRQPLDNSRAGVSVYATVANIYQQLGEPLRAAELLRTAIAHLPSAAARDTDLLRADLKDELASALLGISDLDGAAAANAESEALRARWLPNDPAQQLRTLRNRGWIAYRRGLTTQARPDLEAALALAERHPELLDERIEDSIAALSDIEMRAGDLDLADRHAQQQLQRVEARTPAQHPDRIPAMRQRAAVLNQLGRYGEAQAMLRAAITMHETVIGDSGARLADLENDLTVSLNDSGDALAALPHAERAMTLTDLSRNSSLDRALILMNLSSTFENAGDYPRAEDLAQQSVALYTTEASSEAEERLRAEGNLARVIRLRGRYDEARARFDSVRSRYALSGRAGSWPWAFETYRLAQLERRAGRFDVASALLDEAEPIFIASLPELHPALAQPHRIRGQIALAQQRLDDAQREFDQAAAMIGDNGLDFDRAIVGCEQAAVALQRGHRTQAVGLLQTYLPALRAATLPEEANRMFAESLAAQLGLP
ncbi:MAG: protein kinase [Rhodanobacteraceae bacterium]|nr:protein kinase [Rhodanobacteraceae bacterium]